MRMPKVEAGIDTKLLGIGIAFDFKCNTLQCCFLCFLLNIDFSQEPQ
ncbi:hypothetical protein LCGC14_0820140 [marine sediment metagenome]|uniref:Uncharacterized protein n=1 Tax=marine sediment metagenome TaxID=412755 RepID=A0A0F9PNS7_9ZZZZ